MFDKFPPKYIYVFRNRINPLRNGNPLDEKGRPWASTMCFAWFIWEIGFKGEPIIRWLQTKKDLINCKMSSEITWNELFWNKVFPTIMMTIVGLGIIWGFQKAFA